MSVILNIGNNNQQNENSKEIHIINLTATLFY